MNNEKLQYNKEQQQVFSDDTRNDKKQRDRLYDFENRKDYEDARYKNQFYQRDYNVKENLNRHYEPVSNIPPNNN